MGRRFGKIRRGRTFRERRRGRGFQDPPDDLLLAEAWSTAEDTVLYHAASEGVVAGFDALYARYRAWVLQMALAMTATEDEALRLFQDVFQLWYAQFPGTPGPSVRAELCALLRKRAAALGAHRAKVISLEAYRRRKAARSPRNATREFEATPRENRHPGRVPGLVGLPGDLQEVALLRLGARFQAAEIARALELPLETVRLRIQAVLEHVLEGAIFSPPAVPHPPTGEGAKTSYGLLEAPDEALAQRHAGEAAPRGEDRAENHPPLWAIEAAWQQDDTLVEAPGHAAGRLERVERHLHTCASCRAVATRISKASRSFILPEPVAIPEEIHRAIMLEGHLRAAAIVRRVAEAYPGTSLSLFESVEEANAGGVGGRWTAPSTAPEPGGLESPPPVGQVVALDTGRATRVSRRRLIAVVLLVVLLLVAVLLEGQWRAAEEDSGGPPGWHEQGGSPWPSID